MSIPEDSDKVDANKNKRVLIVEDDAPMARSIQRILRRAGFETAITPDGFRAGALVESFRPVVVTLDLSMPSLGGLDVIKSVQNRESLQNMKILIVSAMPQNDLDAALKAGADDILEKPFANNALIEKVTRLIEV